MSAISPMLKRVYEALASTECIIKGRDSGGGNYDSVVEMWQSQGVSLADEAQNQDWYERSATYYEEHCSETLDGVLGGFAHVSDIDLAASRRFLEAVKSKRPSLQWSDGVGCECGAGIGRVSKGLLLPLGLKRCDLVESSPRLLYAAPEHIGDPGSSRCRYYCDSLQSWQPQNDTYSIIWVQWVLIYLTDTDIIKFLKRCGEALATGGIIVLKENTCDEELFVLDKDDASVTRSLPFLLQLVKAADLSVIHHEIQKDFPDEIFDVPMIAVSKG